MADAEPCPVCSRPMAGPSLSPILLNCGHHVCAGCLPGLESSRCPTCGLPITDAEPSKADAAFLESPLAAPAPTETGKRVRSDLARQWANSIARGLWTLFWSVATFALCLIVGAFVTGFAVAIGVGIVAVFVAGGPRKGVTVVIVWAICFAVVSLYLILTPTAARP